MKRKQYACVDCLHGIRSDRSEYGWECGIWQAGECQPGGAARLQKTQPVEYDGPPCRGCGGPIPPNASTGGPAKVFCERNCGKRYRDRQRPSGGARKRVRPSGGARAKMARDRLDDGG